MILMTGTNPPGTNNDTAPWYRHFYVWLLIIFPVISVIGGIVTLVLAIRTYDGLVVDDYYKHGLEINRTFERDRAAERKDLAASLQIENGNPSFRIILDGNESFRQPASISVSFLHATRGGLDKASTLRRLAGGVYEGNMPDLAPGTWNILIEAQDWRLLKRWDKH